MPGLDFGLVAFELDGSRIAVVCLDFDRVDEVVVSVVVMAAFRTASSSPRIDFLDGIVISIISLSQKMHFITSAQTFLPENLIFKNLLGKFLF